MTSHDGRFSARMSIGWPDLHPAGGISTPTLGPSGALARPPNVDKDPLRSLLLASPMAPKNPLSCSPASKGPVSTRSNPMKIVPEGGAVLAVSGVAALGWRVGSPPGGSPGGLPGGTPWGASQGGMLQCGWLNQRDAVRAIQFQARSCPRSATQLPLRHAAIPASVGVGTPRTIVAVPIAWIADNNLLASL